MAVPVHPMGESHVVSRCGFVHIFVEQVHVHSGGSVKIKLSFSEGEPQGEGTRKAGTCPA